MYSISFRKKNSVGVYRIRRTTWSDVLSWLAEHEHDFLSIRIVMEE